METTHTPTTENSMKTINLTAKQAEHVAWALDAMQDTEAADVGYHAGDLPSLAGRRFSPKMTANTEAVLSDLHYRLTVQLPEVAEEWLNGGSTARVRKCAAAAFLAVAGAHDPVFTDRDDEGRPPASQLTAPLCRYNDGRVEAQSWYNWAMLQ